MAIFPALQKLTHMLLKRMLQYLYSFFGQGNPSSLVDVVVLVHIFSFVCFCHREK